jgi:signal transduction histidine kinase
LPQPILDRLNLGRFRSSFLPALLVVALGVTGIVSYQAYKASREHRTVVESVLAAYVSFVARDVQLSTRMSLVNCAEIWLYPMMLGKAAAEMSEIRSDQCGAADGGRFEIDLANGEVRTDRVSQQLVAWLRDTIPEHPTVEYLRHWQIGLITAPVGDRVELISYGLRLENGVARRAIGIVAAGALPTILSGSELNVPVPKELGTGKLSDFFDIGQSIAVFGASSSGAPYFWHTSALEAKFAGVPLTIGLNERGLAALAPQGLPPNRIWEFLSLFALAVGLVASSLLLLRQQEQLARTRANFVSGVSHELRTPLAQIRLFAEMLLLGRVRSEGDRRRSLQIIDTEARRLSQLVENVLQVARSERGHLHVNPIAMRVAPVIRECVESFTVLAEARSIEFRMELQEDLIAPIDSAALRQIVLNLLDNAAKYGPDGQRVVVGMALYDNNARIWVDDEGSGIPARERERVFNPFYRARDTQQTAGSGIGLAVVRELVALHGGDAWIEDAPDAGARVIVQFPGAQLANAEAGDFAVA